MSLLSHFFDPLVKRFTFLLQISSKSLTYLQDPPPKAMSISESSLSAQPDLSPLNPLKPLQVEPLVPEQFALYGQVVEPSPDGAGFGDRDAQLVLDAGQPRFYIMRLQHRGRRFDRITRHLRCTQCLGSLANQPWLMAVAAPSAASQPDLATLRAFLIPGDRFIKLHLGTWHAGPYFDAPQIDFYNLELSDTNQTDHDTYSFRQTQNLGFELVDI